MHLSNIFFSIVVTGLSLFGTKTFANESVTVKAHPPVVIKKQTPKELLADALSQKEVQTCFEMTDFLQNVVFKDKNFKKTAKNRQVEEVANALSKYATGLSKESNADYFFYMPNSRFYVRVNDKNYRGRMRLPDDIKDSFSACYWENLPSGDVAFSVLSHIDDNFSGYVKISTTLPQMVGNIPDMMSSVGKIRLYTAVDKANFRKRQWFKMRKNEPNKPEAFCWCNGEKLSFLSAIGDGKKLPKKDLKKALASIDEGIPFNGPENNTEGDAVFINTSDGVRLGAIAFVTEKLP